MLPSTTTNSWSERLTSGGRISIPISSHRATKNGTLSFVSMTDEISAAMYSARVVGLQPRRPVGDQRVAGGVRLVEGVVGRLLVGLPEPVDRRRRDAVLAAALAELGLELGHRLAVLLADRLAQVVGLRAREARELLGDQHRLLLVQDHAVGRADDRLQALVGDRDQVRVALAARVGRDLVHGARAVERHERDEVVELGRLDLAQRLLHALGLELEDADRVAAARASRRSSRRRAAASPCRAARRSSAR